MKFLKKGLDFCKLFKPPRKFYPIIFFCTAFLFGISVRAEDSKSSRPEFLRITDNALQTAIYTLNNADSSIRIKLIGVIHVGDVQYYRNIQILTKDLDYLYYEGIQLNSPSPAKIPYLSSFQTETKEERGNRKGVKEIATFQNEFAKAFHFVEQSDYLKPQKNWINADVTISQFLEILKKSNLNLEILTKNLSVDAKTAFEEDSNEISSTMHEEDKDTVIIKYKRKMAKYLVKSAEELCFDDGMKIPREAIIIERNKIALRFLMDKIHSPNPQELGLLYGAAHLPHFLEVLQKEHNFQLHSVEWLDAWSLKSP
jgi:hypothetical protein